MNDENELNSIKLEMLDEFYLEIKQIFRKYFNNNKMAIDKVKYHVNRFYTAWSVCRLDLRTKGKKFNPVKCLSDEEYLRIRYPNWFDNGKSCIVQTEQKILNLNFESIEKGTFRLNLRALDYRNINKDRIPVYVNYRKFKFNNELIFNKPEIAWHNDYFIYRGTCQDNEILNFEIEFETIFDYFPELIQFKNTLIQEVDTFDDMTAFYNNFENYVFQERYKLWKTKDYDELAYNEQVQLIKKIEKMQDNILALKSEIDINAERTHKFFSSLFLDCEIKSTGHLKLVQDLSQEFLDFLVKVINKYGIQYWLSGGALIGAIRHQGFVPWDDDMDIRMMRCDLKRFLKIINYELKENNLDRYVSIHIDRKFKGNLINFVQIFYKNKYLLCGIDIIPLDFIKDPTEETEEIFLEERRKFRKDIRDGVPRIIAEQHYFKKLNISHRPQKHIVEGVDGFLPNKYLLFETDVIFPLGECNFNGSVYACPGDYDKYLTRLYGDYKDIPKSIRNHSRRLNNLKSAKNGKALLEFHIKYLKDINENFE
ncbi:phosphorylcholine transferase LicD [Methanobrevibacter sp.]|uniref:LicD family protein n=1 Tax=Methanobrevibacter sp. TaxID=66852 RepID=UPI00388D647E